MNQLKISKTQLRELASEAARLASDYWDSVEDRPAYPDTSGALTRALAARAWDEVGRGPEVLQDFTRIAEHVRPSGGRFFAYVFGSGEPVSALADLLAGALNQNVTAWRSGPAAAAIEHTVVSWLAEAVGCAGFVGTLCGGGSAANLMALAMARETKLPANEQGVRPCAVYMSEQAHMSMPKAVALLGIGSRHLRMVAVDAQFRMRSEALEAAIVADRSAGLTPIAVVASAGTVNTGSIDPLADIAAVAKRQDLWMHVDGAYGALAALAAPAKFSGLSLADSISLDAHKWLYQTLDCSCLLYRDVAAARRAFSQSGDYVRSLSDDPIEGHAFFDETLELSRRFRALKLWMSLQYHGRGAFRAAIAQDLENAQLLLQLLQAQAELEVLAPVPLSAVCFRHRSCDNESLLARVIRRGRVYISNATLHGQFVLRACFVNHRTTQADVRAIVSEVLAAAAELELEKT